MVSPVSEDDPLVELLDAGRVAEAGAARSRRRWLAAAAAEGATLAGVLQDLVGRADLVTLGILGGATVSAEVLAVGADVVVLDRHTGPLSLVPLGMVTTVEAGGAPVLGDRAAPDGPHLVDLLAAAGEREETVVVDLAGGRVVRGVVDAAGVDVVRIRPEDARGGLTYVSLPSIREVAVFRSG
jgi:hypothetical protein